MTPGDLQIVCDAIHAVLDMRTEDSIYNGARVIKEIDEARKLVVCHGPPDQRRNADPPEFGEKSRWCYCDAERTYDWNLDSLSRDKNHYCDITDHSGICLYVKHKPEKVNQFSITCGPEPSLEHFVDMMYIARGLDERALTVVNLCGSGASIPQHFHTQILSLTYSQEGDEQEDSVAAQLKSIERSDEESILSDKTVIKQVQRPIWGLEIDYAGFSDNPEEVARHLYTAVHKAVRYRSQLRLSYNLYIRSKHWQRITVLFRESRMENVFATREMYELVRMRVGEKQAQAIRDSDNRHWRWGYWEMIGGLMARDHSFVGIEFDRTFWGEVYDRLSLKEKHRSLILTQIEKESQRG